MITEGPSDTVLASHGSADPGRSWPGTATAAVPPTPHPANAAAGRVLAVRASQGRQRDWCLLCWRHYPGLMIF
jgi:hypothetical protein